MSMTFLELLVVDCESPAVAKRLAHYRTLLSPDELSRVDAYRAAADQRAHLVTAALLRWGITRNAGGAPEALRFGRERHGKPYLLTPPIDCAFNASQSGRYAVAAFVAAARVGVDIERVDARIDVDQQATYTFSPEERDLLEATPDTQRRALFFRLWALKEAYAKALGTGLSTDFGAFSVVPEGQAHARLKGAPTTRWHLRNVEVAVGYAAAVAVELRPGVNSDLEVAIEPTVPFP